MASKPNWTTINIHNNSYRVHYPGTEGERKARYFHSEDEAVIFAKQFNTADDVRIVHKQDITREHSVEFK